MTSAFPVAVTKMSARVTASSIVTTSKPSIAACSAQIGSISVTMTRAPPLRSDWARALADIAEAGDDRDLAGQHDVGGAADRVDQRLLAAVKIVELRLGDAVVDVDRGERQLALLGDLVQAVDARGGFLADALQILDGLGQIAGARLDERLQRALELDLLLVLGLGESSAPASRAWRPTARTWWRRRRRRG